MKEYEAPFCRIDLLDLEAFFLNDASGGGYPVDAVTPFHSRSRFPEEDDDLDL